MRGLKSNKYDIFKYVIFPLYFFNKDNITGRKDMK